MEDIKRRFMDTVAARLAAAPQSAEKEELVEELADNLYHRFLDMTGAGLDDETAFTRSMEDLGDVDELLSYLGVEPQKDGAAITTQGGQTRIERPDGRTVVINHGEGHPPSSSAAPAGSSPRRSPGRMPGRPRQAPSPAPAPPPRAISTPSWRASRRRVMWPSTRRRLPSSRQRTPSSAAPP